MASSRRLLQLGDRIKNNTAKVDAYIQDNGMPEPSFDASYPPVLQLSPEVEKARNEALEALDELREHLMGPVGSLVDKLTDLPDFVGLHGIVHFNIIDHIPLDSSKTIAEIASASNMHEDDCNRIIHSASTRRLLTYTPDGKVAHTASSAALFRVPAIANSCRVGFAAQWGSATFVAPAMEKWPNAQELTQTAHNLANGSDLPFFEHLGQNKEHAAWFADGMKVLSQDPKLRVDHVLAYDWSQHAGGTIVDVGGSTGNLAMKILSKQPDVKIVVQDRPEVIGQAPRDLHANIEFQEHDFFAAQPVSGADVYFMRWILHDWPDKYCVKILQALREALKEKARVVIMDAICPEPGVLTPFQDRRIRDYDTVMKMLFNAKERTEKQWRKLVTEADEQGRFEVVDVLQPAGSQLGFVVVEWRG